MRVGGSVAVSRRTPTWAVAPKTAAASATAAAGWNTPTPGFSTSAMPTKPTPMGPHTRRGRGSPSQNRSTSGMISGVE